jgi:prepilin-type N-terminal cleavage/methylation domain-containing protein
MNRRGFTLIEMLVVMAIIGILAGITVRITTLVGEKATRASETKRVELLRKCIEGYYRIHGQYPPTYGITYLSPDPDFPGLPDPGYDGLLYYLENSPGTHEWREYLNQVRTTGRYPDVQQIEGVGWGQFTNVIVSAANAWGKWPDTILYFEYDGKSPVQDREGYWYTSPPPYQTYAFWSKGPDGKTYPYDQSSNPDHNDDDVGHDQWVE